MIAAVATIRTPGRPAGAGGHLRSVPSDERAAPPPADPPAPPAPEPPAPPAPEPPPSPWSSTSGNSTPAAKSLTEAVAGGNYLEILIAQRRLLAELAEHGTGAVKIQALKQLSVVAAEIAEQQGDSAPGGGAPAAGSANSVVADTPDESFDPYED